MIFAATDSERKCKRGHPWVRTKSNSCAQCVHERYLANRDEVIANTKRRYEENREESLAWFKQHYQKNKEARKSKYLAFYAAKKDEIKARTARYKKNNPGRVNAWNRSRKSKARGAAGNIKYSHVEKMLIDQCGRCVACRAELLTYHIDHRMPIALGGDNSPENLQLLCPTCNLRKGAKHPDEFMKEAA